MHHAYGQCVQGVLARVWLLWQRVGLKTAKRVALTLYRHLEMTKRNSNIDINVYCVEAKADQWVLQLLRGYVYTMKRTKAVIIGICMACFFQVSTAYSADIPYQESVVLKVGQSVILKGVRARCKGKKAPEFDALSKLPRSKTGKLSDGGAGTVESNSCGKSVPARAIKFTATKTGTERLNIYKDKIKITVN